MSQIKSYQLVGQRHIDSFANFAGLEELELFACDVGDLEFLRVLPNVLKLRLLCCTASNLAAVTSCPNLEEIEINFCSLEEIEPLVELKRLKRIRLFGNPLSQTAFERLTELQSKEDPINGLCIEFSRRDEWELCRSLWDQGIHLACGRIPRTQFCLV